jgi:hypothetical protein
MSEYKKLAGPSPAQREWLAIGVLSVALVLLTWVPFGLGWSATDRVFLGVLTNPIDGMSYLAKMRQGWRGEWLFTLPYTAEPGEGAFLYFYYILLGHIARWTGFGLEVVNALARSLSGLVMLLVAFAFVSQFLSGSRARLGAWLLFAVGSGLGWAAVPFGFFTSDLWVAEAIPFLTLIANAHFGPALALLLLLVALTAPPLGNSVPLALRLAAIVLGAIVLGLVQPLALLNVYLIVAPFVAWQVRLRRRLAAVDWLPMLVFALVSLPWIGWYAYILNLAHPVLAEWSAQNLTPSPPIWDAVISGGVVLVLALPGAVVAARRGSGHDRLLVAWLVVGALALYMPFALQRRLAMGLWMPLCILAVVGLREWLLPRLQAGWRPIALGAVALLALPSNLLVYAAITSAVVQRDPALYLTPGEAAALDWLEHHASPGTIVLTSPELGLAVPAHTELRVLYGHPFETLNASAWQAAILDFYAGRLDRDAFVGQYRVGHVVFGPRELELLDGAALPAWPIVFDSDGVAVYAP